MCKDEPVRFMGVNYCGEKTHDQAVDEASERVGKHHRDLFSRLSGMYKLIDRAVLSGDEAATFLGLSSRKGMQRLVDQGLVTPLAYGKSHIFSLVELRRFLEDELDRERGRRSL